jgi:DNA-binding NarL/FixJ family response regulator
MRYKLEQGREGREGARMGEGYILVVDADDAGRSFAVALFARAGFNAVGTGSGADGLALARRERPALVLLEVSLPDVDGYEVCRELRDAFGDALPIVFTSADRTDPHDLVAGLLVGGDDYVLKSSDPSELLARVRRHFARAGVGRAASISEHKPSDSFGLTKRELEVLRRLAGGLTPPEIARELVISPKTVASHLQRVLSKMCVHSRIQAVALAHEHGLIAEAVGARARQSGIDSS